MKARKPLARLGKKRLAALGDGPRPRSTVKSSGRPKPRNAKRKAKEFRRCYGSELRVMWFQRQPCVACGWPESENAHSVGGGGSRKADADTIVPLCGPRWWDVGMSAFGLGTMQAHYAGCHRLYDEHRSTFTARYPHLDLPALAAQFDARYREEQGQ